MIPGKRLPTTNPDIRLTFYIPYVLSEEIIACSANVSLHLAAGINEEIMIFRSA
jgi:hypothetical protein